MSIVTNKTTIRRYYEEVLNERKLGLLEEFVVLDHVEHDPLPGQGTGLAGFQQRVEMLTTAIRQHFTIEHLIAEDDMVAVHWTTRAVQEGAFLGIPATGRAYTISGIDIHRLRDGKLAEHWHVVDIFSMMQQLGVLPQPDPGGR